MTASSLLNGIALTGILGMAMLVEPAPAPTPVSGRYSCFVQPDEIIIKGDHRGLYFARPDMWVPCSSTQLAWAWRNT